MNLCFWNSRPTCFTSPIWWRHQMETFSALLALCVGNSPISGEFPSWRPVVRSFDVFFDLRLNKWLSKQSWGWWFETPSSSLWRHCNGWYGYWWHDDPRSQGISRLNIDTVWSWSSRSLKVKVELLSVLWNIIKRDKFSLMIIGNQNLFIMCTVIKTITKAKDTISKTIHNKCRRGAFSILSSFPQTSYVTN